MVSLSSSLANQNLRVIKPESPTKKEDLARLASFHLSVLANTASSKAGLSVIVSLYDSVSRDPNGVVVYSSNDQVTKSGKSLEGGFASGTTNLRKTQSFLISNLPLTIKIRLACTNLLFPRHLLAQRAWMPLIPNQNAGYILTIGVSGNPEVRKLHGLPKGHEILSHLEQQFRNRGCLKVWVDTELSNQHAIEFYKKQGYSVVTKTFGQLLFNKTI